MEQRRRLWKFPVGPQHMVTGQPKDRESQQVTLGEFWLMDMGSSEIQYPTVWSEIFVFYTETFHI